MRVDTFFNVGDKVSVSYKDTTIGAEIEKVSRSETLEEELSASETAVLKAIEAAKKVVKCLIG